MAYTPPLLVVRRPNEKVLNSSNLAASKTSAAAPVETLTIFDVQTFRVQILLSAAVYQVVYTTYSALPLSKFSSAIPSGTLYLVQEHSYVLILAEVLTGPS